MKLIEAGGYPGTKSGTALALGYFDGIHIGHQAVIRAVAEYGDANNLDRAVFTFSMQDENGPKGKRILSAGQKHRVLAELNMDYCFEPPFESFKEMAPEDFFYKMLKTGYRAKALFCGEDFYFGANRSGSPALLKKLAEENEMELFVIPLTDWQGEAVSSSRIRQELEKGDIEAANGMLGRPYEIDFHVQHGAGLGHTLGFPTLNQIFPPEMQLPEHGVYITQTLVDGKKLPSATGFGFRPTVGGESATCETFIPGFSGDLYGKQIRVQFYKKIDSIHKFESKQALAEAVQRWANLAMEYFKD